MIEKYSNRKINTALIGGILLSESILGFLDYSFLSKKADAEEVQDFNQKIELIIDERERAKNRKTLETALEEVANRVKMEKAPRYVTDSGAHCVQYARMAARGIYGKKFNPAGFAWELRNKNKIVSEVRDEEQLIKLADSEILKPGMIVGTYYEDSGRNRKGRKYTHVVLYVGKNEEGTLIFIHEWANKKFKKQEKISLDDFEKYHLRPVEILDAV